MDKRCVDYDALGGPAKLSRYNKDPICEACQRGANQDSGFDVLATATWRSADPYDNYRKWDLNVLESSAVQEARRLRHKLVADLFLRQGPFWGAVREMRFRWNIAAIAQLPSVRPSSLGPPPQEGGPFVWPEDDVPREWTEEHSMRWRDDLASLWRESIPERYGHFHVWESFLAACVRYDPPEVKLVAFADYGSSLNLDSALPSGLPRTAGTQLPHMPAAPIKNLRDPDRAEADCQWFYETLIDELGERYFRHSGLDIRDLVKEVLRDNPKIWDEFGERLQQNRHRWYITVDEHTTTDDVKNAARMIAATLPERPREGRKARDPLIAIQCAILFDREEPLPNSRRKWSYKRLAEDYELKSVQSAKDHVKVGRRFLQGK
jgi:hypothetical protein